jgi:hypothetical protein
VTSEPQVAACLGDFLREEEGFEAFLVLEEGFVMPLFFFCL